MEIEKAIGICKNLLKIEYDGCFGTKVYHPHSMSIEDVEAIETVLKEFERLKEENTDLKELYVKVAKNIKEKGNLELAEYMLAQIEATPTFTTWEDYKTWVSKDKIRAKIEYYENALDDDFADIEDYLKMKYGKEVLKELLEEE